MRKQFLIMWYHLNRVNMEKEEILKKLHKASEICANCSYLNILITFSGIKMLICENPKTPVEDTYLDFGCKYHDTKRGDYEAN